MPEEIVSACMSRRVIISADAKRAEINFLGMTLYSRRVWNSNPYSGKVTSMKNYRLCEAVSSPMHFSIHSKTKLIIVMVRHTHGFKITQISDRNTRV